MTPDPGVLGLRAPERLGLRGAAHDLALACATALSTMPAMLRALLCGTVLFAWACATPAKQVAGDSPPATVAAQTAGASAPAATPASPKGVVLWSTQGHGPLPAELRQALVGTLVEPDPGALAAALSTLAAAKKAQAELRCNETLTPVAQAIDLLLQDHSVTDTQALLGELYSVLLLCADRLNQGGVARRAGDALFALQTSVPPDVALVLARHQTPRRYGPPLPPVRVESDPPGAHVRRNLLVIGPTPTTVEGGEEPGPTYDPTVPAHPTDFIDVELAGHRKLHRLLPARGELVLALRPEDRPQVLLEQAALQEPGSDAQAARLRVLADVVQASKTPSSPRHIVVAWPKQRAGSAVAGEALLARVYDLDRRAWGSGISEIGAGAAAVQVQGLASLPQRDNGSTLPGVAAALATGQKPAANQDRSTGAGKEAPKKKGLFGNTKWYTWAVAGGVVALIAGLLIAEKVSPEKVTVSATR